MVEAFESSFNVARHGDITSVVGVVPFEGEATVEFDLPVGGDCVLLTEDGCQMLGMFAANIFDCKVVDYKAKGDGSGLVSEETKCVFILVVAAGG